MCVQGGARVGQCCWGVFYRGIFLRADWIVVRLAGRADTHAYYRRQRKVAGGLQPGGAVRPQHGGRAAIFGGGASPCGLAVAVAAFPKGLAVEIASGWASLEIDWRLAVISVISDHLCAALWLLGRLLGL